MTEVLLVIAIVLAVYFAVQLRTTRAAAVAFGLENAMLTKAVRRVAENIDTAPTLYELQQLSRHGRWANELRRACHKAETYYHLSVKLGLTSRWEKEHGSHAAD